MKRSSKLTVILIASFITIMAIIALVFAFAKEKCNWSTTRSEPAQMTAGAIIEEEVIVEGNNDGETDGETDASVQCPCAQGLHVETSSDDSLNVSKSKERNYTITNNGSSYTFSGDENGKNPTLYGPHT